MTAPATPALRTAKTRPDGSAIKPENVTMEDGVRVLEAKLGRKLSTLKNFEQVDITLGELKREFGFAKMSDLSTFMGRVYDGSIVVDGVKLHVRSKNPDFGLKTTDSFVLSRRDDFK